MTVDPTWSSDLPDVPGWYWFVASEWEKPTPVYVRRGFFRRWFVKLFGWQEKPLKKCRGFWSPMQGPPSTDSLDWSGFHHGQAQKTA